MNATRKLPWLLALGIALVLAAAAAGVRNALARLPQTQGLSEAERETVRAHLRGHLGTGDDDSEGRAETPAAEPETEPAETTETPTAARLIVEIAAYFEANPDDDAVRTYLAALRPATSDAPGPAAVETAPGREPEPAPDGGWSSSVAHLTTTAPADGWAAATAHLKGAAE